MSNKTNKQKNRVGIIAVMVAVMLLAAMTVCGCTMPFASTVSQSDAAVSDTDVSDADAEPVVDEREVLISCISEDEMYSVGDIVTYGAYEQDGDTANGEEPIEWRILAIEDDRVLVISEYGLDAKPFNEKREDTTWADCTLRKWLNKDFLNSAFSKEERENILTVMIENPENPVYHTGAQPDTEDTIFVLSQNEKDEYFPDFKKAGCYPTQYAINNGVKVSDEDFALGMCHRYWLRTMGDIPSSVAFVLLHGMNAEGGGFCNDDYVAVRPAMYLGL